MSITALRRRLDYNKGSPVLKGYYADIRTDMQAITLIGRRKQ